MNAPNGAVPILNSSQAKKVELPLVDRFGRVHRSLRISVTDRCNIRCQYCMPEVATFLSSNKLLTFEQITQFVQAVVPLGIQEVRITGGEPLMRPGLAELFRMLRSIDQLADIALTTNGMMLSEQLDGLVEAGLRRINISLDTLNEEVFQRLSRRQGLDKVLDGIDAAASDSRVKVRLNALVMRDVNLSEVLDLVAFARDRLLPLRFIEFMPLDAERAWNRSQMVSGKEMRERIATRFGELTPLNRLDPSQPSVDYGFADGKGVVGFIDSVSQPFCSGCDRLRLTADGKIRNCLFGQEEWDIRQLSLEEIPAVVRDCLAAKRAAHGIDAQDFSPPERAMFQIGG